MVEEKKTTQPGDCLKFIKVFLSFRNFEFEWSNL